MRIAALGSLASPTPTTPQTRALDGRDAVRIAGHVVLQAAFLAPGLALFGVRGWRLVGASLGGSASFTLLSWLWASANGFSFVPAGDATSGGVSPQASTVATPRRDPRPSNALPDASEGVTYIDV